MNYIIIECQTGKILGKARLTPTEMNKAWGREIIVINPEDKTILFGTDFISFKKYNELVESGEAKGAN